MVFRATVTTLIGLGVVNIPVSTLYILATRLVFPLVVRQAAVPIVNAISTIDAIELISRVADVVVVSAGGALETFQRVFHGFCECLLESHEPDWGQGVCSCERCG